MGIFHMRVKELEGGGLWSENRNFKFRISELEQLQIITRSIGWSSSGLLKCFGVKIIDTEEGKDQGSWSFG